VLGSPDQGGCASAGGAGGFWWGGERVVMTGFGDCPIYYFSYAKRVKGSGYYSQMVYRKDGIFIKSIYYWHILDFRLIIQRSTGLIILLKSGFYSGLWDR
jgi:hypothetical protein